MKKPKTYIYIIVCAICIFLSIIFFLASNSKTVYSMNYQEKGDIQYKVYLKANDHYDELFLEEDMRYITDLIDYIDINYNYNLKTSNKFDIVNNNSMNANIIIKEKNKILYKKNISLEESETKKYKNDNIHITKNVKIDYQQYNDIVKQLLKEYNITKDVTNVLEVELSIINDYDIEKIPLLTTDEKSIKLEIPLLENTIELSEKYHNINDNKTVKYSVNKEINNYILLGISILFLTISIVMFIILLISIKTNNFYKHQYKKLLKNILKKYDKNIVKVKDIPDLRGFEVYDVVSFEELLDTSKIYNKPIMHMEIEKDRINLFFVEENNLIYQYLMRTRK